MNYKEEVNPQSRSSRWHTERLKVCVRWRQPIHQTGPVRGHTVLAICCVFAGLVESLIAVPADQRVEGTVVHGNARPVLQVAQTWGTQGETGNKVLTQSASPVTLKKAPRVDRKWHSQFKKPHVISIRFFFFLENNRNKFKAPFPPLLSVKENRLPFIFSGAYEKTNSTFPYSGNLSSVEKHAIQNCLRKMVETNAQRHMADKVVASRIQHTASNLNSNQPIYICVRFENVKQTALFNPPHVQPFQTCFCYSFN